MFVCLSQIIILSSIDIVEKKDLSWKKCTKISYWNILGWLDGDGGYKREKSEGLLFFLPSAKWCDFIKRSCYAVLLETDNNLSTAHLPNADKFIEWTKFCVAVFVWIFLLLFNSTNIRIIWLIHRNKIIKIVKISKVTQKKPYTPYLQIGI